MTGEGKSARFQAGAGQSQKPQKPLSAHDRSRFTRPIPRRELFVPGTLDKAPTVSLIFGSRTTRNRQRCMFPPLGAQTPASRIFWISSFGTGSGFSRRIDRVVRIISNRSAVFIVASDMAY